MVLAQKQKYGSMEQDRTPRNKPMHQNNQLIYDKGGKTIQMWERQSLQQMVLKKRDSHM